MSRNWSGTGAEQELQVSVSVPIYLRIFERLHSLLIRSANC